MSPVRLPRAAIVAAAFCLLSAGPVVAATKQEKQDSAKQRIERIASELGESRGSLDAAREAADRTAAKEAELEGLISAGAARSARLGDRVSRSSRNLNQTRKRLKRARSRLGDRLVSIYMSGRPDPIGMLIGSGSLADLATTSIYLQSITDADTHLATRVADLRSELAGHVAKLARAKHQVDAHNAELEQARAGITAVRVKAQATAERLEGIDRSRRSEISRLKSDISAWQRQIERENKAAAEEAEQQVSRSLGGPYSIPSYIVMCESGGNYSAVNPSSGAGGAYQIMPATWRAYGGKGLPQNASKAEQDRIAALIWADVGASAWSCA